MIYYKMVVNILKYFDELFQKRFDDQASKVHEMLHFKFYENLPRDLQMRIWEYPLKYISRKMVATRSKAF